MAIKPIMTIRADEDWHRMLKVEAVLRDTTITNLVREAVDEWLKNHPRGDRSEALRIAREILDQAEQERLAVAEREAACGIQPMDEAIDG